MSSTEPKGDTFHSRAMFEAELGAQGRFSARERPTINGSPPSVAPLAAPDWSRAWPEDVAKVDEDINAVPDMTTVDGAPRE